MSYQTYSSRFTKKKALGYTSARGQSADPDAPAFMSDKQAYVKFLEDHLDKLTNSVQAIDGFTERIYNLEKKSLDTEQKYADMNKLLLLFQDFSDA